LAADVDPRDRVRSIIYHMSHFDNSVQYHWFLEIARAFLNFQGRQITLADCTWLCDTADRLMSAPDWTERVFRQSNLEKVFLTNEFDYPLEGFDTERYVPCLRTDDLVFRMHEPTVKERLCHCTGVQVADARTLETALSEVFQRFVRRGAKACAISLP